MPTDIPMFDVLLERMKTHPEEFSEGIESSRWGKILETYSDCLTTEERKKLADGVHSARRQMLNEAIMKRLAGEDEPSFLPIEAPNRFTFNTANRAVWDSTTHHDALHKMFESVNRLREEQEIEAMHDYYKKLGQAE